MKTNIDKLYREKPPFPDSKQVENAFRLFEDHISTEFGEIGEVSTAVLVRLVCNLCEAYERQGFEYGFKMAAKLVREVLNAGYDE